MTAGSELRRLKSEMSSFECLNYEDLKFYTNKIGHHIRLIYENSAPQDPLVQKYIDHVVIRHVQILEEFIANLDNYQGREEFLSKSLKYHFNCIIDSYTYAVVAFRSDRV